MAHPKQQYSTPIRTKQPTCLILLVDRSGSMSNAFGNTGLTKADACAWAANNVLMESAIACQAQGECRDRLYVGVIGYGARGLERESVGSILRGNCFAGRTLVPISELWQNPFRIEEEQGVDEDENGNPFPVSMRRYIWVEPYAQGGTPMHKAFNLAREWIENWTQEHPDSFPPVVVNITDGEPNELPPYPVATHAATRLRQTKTSNGHALLLNGHISADSSEPTVLLPGDDSQLVSASARFIFEISSPLPPIMRGLAESLLVFPKPGARGCIYNADVGNMVRLLQFGSSLVA